MKRSIAGIVHSMAVVLSVAATLGLSGCDVDTLDPTAGAETYAPGYIPPPHIPSVAYAIPNYGILYTTARANYSRAGGEYVSYQSGGQLYRTTGHGVGVEGGRMIASDLLIEGKENGEYVTTQEPQFGAVTAWGLTGNPVNDVPPFTTTMYVPQMLRVEPLRGGAVQSVASDIQVMWNADPENRAGVVVELEYLRDISMALDPDFPDTTVQWSTHTEDDGEFTIPASVVGMLPNNGFGGITVSRGNSMIAGPLSHRFFIYASTCSRRVFELVP